MDKISAVLIFGIISLLLTGGVMVYDVWIEGSPENQDVQVIMDYERQETELVFNDDTSIKNNSFKSLWVRAKPVYNGEYDAGGYKIISGAIEDGMWSSGGEDWYYYKRPIGFAEKTEPLIDRLTYNGEEVSEGGSGKFTLQVEAVDREWFVTEPSDGLEAFRLFEDAMIIPDKTYL